MTARPNQNAPLAVVARREANAARDGSAERKTAGCVAVALSTTRTVAAARKALATVRPDAVRDDALTYLGRLVAASAVPVDAQEAAQ